VSSNVVTLDRSALRLSVPGDLRLAMPLAGVVDRASPEATVSDDIDGSPRTRDGRADIGAHEWRGPR
jgi:hypothetical protein